jgi:hypothetical protein
MEAPTVTTVEPETLLPTLTLVGEAALTGAAGDTTAQMPLTGPVAEGSALILAYGSGATSANLSAVSDEHSNAWQVAGFTNGGRPSGIAVCLNTTEDMAAGDLLTITATNLTNGVRLQLWASPRLDLVTMPPAGAYASTGTALSLPLPAELGELIFAVQVNQGTYGLTGATWPLLRVHAQGSPALRTYWLAATGTDEFDATMGTSGAWSITAIRLTLWEPPPEPEPPPPEPGTELVPVTWDGIDLNPGYRDDGLLAIVTDVEGWYGTPPLEGGDLERALADGAVWGPKTVKARVVGISGAVTGPRDLCLLYVRQLAALAASKVPAPLTIGEDGHQLQADVRAGTDQMTVAWSGPILFRYQVSVTAADARLFSATWDDATLMTGAGIDTGRHYPRDYSPDDEDPPSYAGWTYGAADLPNSGRLVNEGNTDAPVWATYTGPLGESRLTNGVGTLRMAPIPEGVQITVATETMAAWAPGGASRASYVLAGSTPMMLPAYSVQVWRLYALAGEGSVLLRYREAWS